VRLWYLRRAIVWPPVAGCVAAATLLVVAGLYKPEMKVEIEVTAKLRSD